MIEQIQTLNQRLDVTLALRDIAEAMAGVVPIDRLGVAVAEPDASGFSVIGLFDRVRGALDSEGVRFDEPAANWVCAHDAPLVAASPSDIASFERTQEMMGEAGMQSACILPLDTGAQGNGVLFLFSQRHSAFPPESLGLCERVRRVVEPVTIAYLETSDLLGTRPIPAEPVPDATPSPLTLAEAERRYIETILASTKGRIEGSSGAATLLGLPPSTLRHKIRKLGVNRHVNGAQNGNGHANGGSNGHARPSISVESPAAV